jgi:hypothetical protein
LIVLKFYALPSLYRQGKFDRAALYETDILQLTYNYDIELEEAIKIVEDYLIESDRSEIRSIARDIEQRRERMIRAATAVPEDELEL